MPVIYFCKLIDQITQLEQKLFSSLCQSLGTVLLPPLIKRNLSSLCPPDGIWPSLTLERTETTKGVSTEITGLYVQLNLARVCLATTELATSEIVVIS